MTVALAILAISIAVPLLYLASLDGNYQVRRTIQIAAPRKDVFDKVRDFKSWPDWNPWLMHEPNAQLVYSDATDQQGSWYSWDGEIIGAGKLTHESFTEERKIEQCLEFTRPFKSVCKVWWEFEKDIDGNTVACWNMSGKMPFLFRFMAKRMPEFIGKDYETGLTMLRAELVDDAEVPRITFDGEVELPPQAMLSLHFEGHLSDMIQAMETNFPQLGSYLDAKNIEAIGPPFTIYSHVDIQNKQFICDMAFPVPDTTQTDDYDMHIFPGGKFYKVTVRGSYAFLELAWYQAYSHLQMMKKKPRSRRPSIEMYENDPGTVSHTNEIVTSLYIPVK